MQDDRAQVLAAIRASLPHAHLPMARATLPPRRKSGQGDPAQLVNDFVRELEAVGGVGHIARDDEAAIEIVMELLNESEGRELLAWDDADLGVRGLGEALRAGGYTRLMIDLPHEPEARRAHLLELERASAGITGASAGLADTGSLALVTSASRPRLASLLPPTHIALVHTSQLYPDMSSFLNARADLFHDASNLVLVTGPSRTADIELTLTRGVHGPKFLHVILLP